ncbi:hypothetical protein IW146_008438 [Coemansia sp. RSA 922]|nr:hypothetical protein GGI08_006560 [Coemansia sp. S2]KAJ2074499.1 hypothetical protein GGH13_001274 [Coemansia sp. S155-1]KAJ2104960.1 hypothetical protein IW146_008438 [Coemansia sp. RSA 922]
MQQELARARDYRSSRRPSLVASWSETSLVNHGLNDSDDSEQTRRPPGDNQPYLEEARVVREPPVYISVRSKVPDIPLPPPPVARRVGVDYSLLDPVQGNFATLDSEFVMMHPHNRAKYSLDATTSTIVENQQLPPAVHKSGIHRSTNSLPVNVPFLSAPPADALLTVEPSAPPIAGRVRSFNSAGHMRRPSNDSGSRGIGRRVPPIHASASPPHDVRMAAIQDAHANLNRKMFSDKVLNFRDIGVSAIKAGIQLHQDKARAESVGPMPGVVFRSAELGSACEHDVKMLFSKYGIRTIIDLRSELEARASDIMMRHYPASIQPTADQSMEKLMKLRAMQLQNTIVEVAAHGYESAARPWEKTGESRASWSHRNSLRYSKSIGDPRKDPLARALVHLYDKVPEDDAQETQNITLDEPYVPLFVPPAETVYPPQRPAVPRKASFSAANSQLDVHHGHISYAKDSPTLDMSDVEASTLQHSGLAQSALDWGSETLQSLRSYWDQQWAGAAGPQSVTGAPPNTGSVAVEDLKKEHSASLVAVHPDPTNEIPADYVSTESSDTGAGFDSDSDSLFYRNSPNDANRINAPYGLLPVAQAGHSSVVPYAHAISNAAAAGLSAKAGTSQSRIPELSRSRATTEPIFAWHSPMSARTKDKHDADGDDDDDDDDGPQQRVALKHSSPQSERPGIGVSKITVQNKFSGQRSRYRCNIIGENYRKRCVWAHTPWSTRIKVIWRFAIFNKAEAIRTIGREVLTPRGLAGSYEDYVDYCKEEFAAVMRIFADPCAYPILFHCQHGKDRTGIVAMLLLGILGVDEEVIAADYAQSQDNLAPVRKRMELLDMGAVGLPPSFCDSPTFVMRNLLRHINYNYGSVRGYLRSAGLKEQEINTIAWCLRGNFYGVVHEKSRKAHAEARRLYLHPSAARSAVIVSPSARGPLPPSSLQISRRESADWS